MISDYISGDCVVSVVDTVLGFPASTCEREEEGDLGACGVSAWLAGLWWLAGCGLGVSGESDIDTFCSLVIFVIFWGK